MYAIKLCHIWIHKLFVKIFKKYSLLYNSADLDTESRLLKFKYFLL